MAEQRPLTTPTNGEPAFAAFVAIDWADQKHTWSMQAAGSTQRESGEVENRPEAVEEWMQTLLQRCGGQPIAVCLEQSRGALICMLMKYATLTLYPLHPASVGRFRAAFYPSGTKDDPLDADLQLEILVHHRNRLRPWRPDTIETRKIQILVVQRRQWVDQRTAYSNELTQLLKQYYPQALNWFAPVSGRLARAFLHRWPTLPLAQTARPETLRHFFYQHNSRSEERIQQRIEQIAQAMPATQDPAIVDTAVVQLHCLIRLLGVVEDNIAKLDQELQAVAPNHPDFAVFDSFPGAGEVLAPRLIAAFGAQRDRFSEATEVQSFSGIGPVRVCSGNTEWVHIRRACSKFLRQTFHEWAGHSVSYSGWARAYYEQQIDKGNDHHAAVRALAAKWIRIAYRCWQDHTPYDEQRYLAALRRRGSPLVARLAPASS